MPFRPLSVLGALWSIAAATLNVHAQDPSTCTCTDRGSEVFHTPDTLFQVVDGFDVAYCGRIDRSVHPFVYSNFTMWCCGAVRDSLEARGAPQGCHLYVSHGQFTVDGLVMLPTGADMQLVARPCWRTEHRLVIAEDGTPLAVAGPITNLIATFQRPTPDQVRQIQARVDGLKHALYWTDQALLGQVFLCALFDATWATRFRELREGYLWGGTNVELYDEFLKILHEKRK